MEEIFQMIVWTFTEIAIACFFGLLALVVVVYIIYGISEYLIHKLFYKNCRKCKHCKLHNVASYGDGADYSCELSNKPYDRLNKNGMVKFSEPIWRRCNKFER